ncbi:hypothetical protein A3H81_01625 [Candidatus Daviesbacteria bacterium RIFCSPLOWO2_02_FULL_38_18]|uniref:NAD-dependent epimerase/dehydratase family protein n=1 Tax=Candidatus Daviesbacteria bacterium GW2011_GWF2_38_6 TaxID=1618432 RepID=A0A0G0KS64_9BACT|nr:MAG: NAD-dependent epimerase/dehydratase family protein [Candidatus Daviesbacteria bacterium GW2011_GWF2_38_6]OGE67930.1 MAG: hypothetical protein A3H81_01625 [Candidatus Daviesbacteria bacterium RIFCSPLOWO2_02_FULL_38_18]OGE73343.1 MAG: hypothetical protein A3H18_04765 [Candidatus Daviesbacteria bacterium RIFCSPLOWO2_12_FULL_38_10]HCB22837.1 hypothetical protein [Candidatus Daviesbacteria bacterium]
MNILITGGTGFIGSHLIYRLLSLGYKITLLKRPSSDIWRIKDIVRKINTIDIDSLENLESIFINNDFEMVIHLAATYIKETNKRKEISQMKTANITFPSKLLRLAIKNKVKYFINTGTCFEYKLSDAKIDENHKIAPYNFYASTKIAFEALLKSFAEKNYIRGITLKLFYPYGEKDNKNKVIPQMIKATLNKEKMLLTKGGQELNFTYVGDVVNAFVKTLSYISSKKYRKYEVFNIGVDKAYKLQYIGKLLEDLSGNNSILYFLKPYSLNEIMYMSCNYKKAKKLLKWKPETGIIKGITRTYEDFLGNIK